MNGCMLSSVSAAPPHSHIICQLDGVLYPVTQVINEEFKQNWAPVISPKGVPLVTGLQLDFVLLITTC